MSIPNSREYPYDVCRLIIDRLPLWGVTPVCETLGEFVERRRKDLGIGSQSALAELAGLDTSVINRLEKNRDPDYNPKADTLVRLAVALRVSVDTLLRYTGARDQMPPLPDDADTGIEPPMSLEEMEADIMRHTEIPEDIRLMIVRDLRFAAERVKP